MFATWGRKADTPTTAPSGSPAALAPITAGKQKPAWNAGKGWDLDRAVSEGMERVVWVYRAADAICRNYARLSYVRREGNPVDGAIVEDDPLIARLNSWPNSYEPSYHWRWRLMCTYLLSPKGAFVEIVRNNLGEVAELHHLTVAWMTPVPHRRRFLSHFEYQPPGEPKIRLEVDQVLWVRQPHPTDPYRSLTPLEAAGLSIDTDYLARLYNRSFLDNDARPGVLLVARDTIVDPDESDRLKARFEGVRGAGPVGAGRVELIGAGEHGIDVLDLAVNPRDSEYIQGRKITKEEIYAAFGVPETVAGNASGRTFANADAEWEVFWRDTMTGHIDGTGAFLDQLTGTPTDFIRSDISSVEVLNRDEHTRRRMALAEVAGGVLLPNEYRDSIGLGPIAGGDTLRAASAGTAAGTGAKIGRVAKDDQTAADAWAVLLDRYEDPVRKVFERLFERQARVVAEKLRSRKSKARHAEKALTEDDLFDRQMWDRQLDEDIAPVQTEMMLDIGTAAAAAWDAAFLLDPNVGGQLAARRALLAGVNETTAAAIGTAIRDGIAAAETVDQIATRIAAVFVQASDERALTIARTEVNWTANAAQMAAARQSGVVRTKTWLAVGDSRTREAHATASGQTVALDMPFDVAGELIDHPGEGSPANSVHCRCTVIYGTDLGGDG